MNNENCAKIKKDGKTVRISKTSRGLVEHSKKVGAPIEIELRQAKVIANYKPFLLTAKYPDDSFGFVWFTDEISAGKWARSRPEWDKTKFVGNDKFLKTVFDNW